MSLSLRLLFGSVGLMALMPFYDLLAQSDVQIRLRDRDQIDAGLAALAVGVAMMLAAIFGPARTIIVDPAARQIVVQRTAALGVRWQSRYRFSDLGSVRVTSKHNFETRQVYHRVEIPCLVLRQPIEIETFPDAIEASETARRIAAMTSRLVV